MEKIKKRYQKFKISSDFLVIGIVFLCVLFLIIGWSAFLQKLYINDIALNIQAKKDIRITDLFVSNKTNSNVISSDFDHDKIFIDVDLSSSTSNVVLDVEVTNFENTEMGILKIDGLPDNLELVIDGYNLEEKICDANRCNLNIKKNFQITLKYKDGGYVSSDTIYNLTLTFDFRSFHKITYEGIKGDKLPNEVIDGGEFQATLDSSIKSNNLEILMGEIKITDFTYENNLLQIENITDDLIIKYNEGLKTPLYAFMEDQSLGTDKDIDFTNTNIIPGIYMHEETKNDSYPVYYYRGSVTNNNVIYANYCWKIVRTTETGGIKLVYSGDVSDGQCKFTHDYLGSEAFNEEMTNDSGAKVTTPSQVGYMYGETRAIELIAPSYMNDTDGVIQPGIVIGHNVKYENGEYYLVEYEAVNDLNDLEDEIRGGTYSIGYHYTCLSSANSCKEVYYIYFDDYGSNGDTSADGLYGIKLDDGRNIKETLDALLSHSSNEINSHAKDYLDEFFQGIGSDYKRAGGDPLINHKDELDDVQWCNDRSIAGYHGWDLSTDNHNSHNKYLHFAAYGRLIGDEGWGSTRSRPDITCDNTNDAFTVSASNGNGKLTYPIGMLTADEAVLAGAIEDVDAGTYLKIVADKNQFFMTPYYISDDHVRLFALTKEGHLSSGYAENGWAIRPAIALKPIFNFASGDGTKEHPYILEKN